MRNLWARNSLIRCLICWMASSVGDGLHGGRWRGGAQIERKGLVPQNWNLVFVLGPYFVSILLGVCFVWCIGKAVDGWCGKYCWISASFYWAPLIFFMGEKTCRNDCFDSSFEISVVLLWDTFPRLVVCLLLPWWDLPFFCFCYLDCLFG